MTSDFAIDVRGLCKSFGAIRAVDGVSLRIRRGEIFGFLGPNGSGKTTTLRMLCGLLVPDDGEGTCLGLDVIRDSAGIKKRIGYMTQRFGLYDELTLEENLLFVARAFGMPKPRVAARQTLEELGMVERRRQQAGTLSGGWKQRLALGAAMMHRPELLLLDEPTAGVDPKARRAFWTEIHRLADKGITVLVTTHYMDEAERCHRLAYLSNGRLLAEGDGPELIANSGLITWQVRGPGLEQLEMELSQLVDVETVAAFGNSLHVSGSDEALLAAALKSAMGRTELDWGRIEPGLEDVFIHFMIQDQREAA